MALMDDENKPLDEAALRQQPSGRWFVYCPGKWCGHARRTFIHRADAERYALDHNQEVHR